MGTTWISWRTFLVLAITLQHIQAVISVKTTKVSGVEGQRFDFRCEYQKSWENNVKYFYQVEDTNSSTPVIRTDKHNEWKKDGRLSLYDNTTGAFFIVRLEKLYLNDSGTYWCGVDISLRPDHISVIQLNVSQANERTVLTTDYTRRKLSLQLSLTAAVCFTAVLFVCLFSCVLLTMKHRRSGLSERRKTLSDYEIMMPGVKTKPEPCCKCSAPDCHNRSALPPPPDDLSAHFTPKHRESAVSLSHGEYVDVEAPGHISQYQHLDLSRLEEHVYHTLREHCCPKHGNVKEKIPSDITVNPRGQEETYGV